MYPRFDLAVHHLGDGEELDRVAQVPGKINVERGDLRNPLGIDVVELHRRAEGKHRKDGKLVGRIDAFYIERRVRLGIALCLGFLQHLVELSAGARHERQDIIARPVHNAVEGPDIVRGKTVPERPEDGDAPCHRRLEPQGHTGLFRGAVDFLTVHREKRLVRRDHVLFIPYRIENELLGRFVSPDELHHNVDVRVGQDILCIGRKLHTGERNSPVALDVQIGDLLEHHRRAQAPLDDVRVLHEDAGRARAHGAEADDADVD